MASPSPRSNKSKEKLPEIGNGNSKHTCTQIWRDNDTGRDYRIIERMGD